MIAFLTGRVAAQGRRLRAARGRRRRLPARDDARARCRRCPPWATGHRLDAPVRPRGRALALRLRERGREGRVRAAHHRQRRRPKVALATLSALVARCACARAVAAEDVATISRRAGHRQEDRAAHHPRPQGQARHAGAGSAASAAAAARRGARRGDATRCSRWASRRRRLGRALKGVDGDRRRRAALLKHALQRLGGGA